MVKEPNFLKEFSREQSKDERDKKAQEIKAKRFEYFDKKKRVKAFEEETKKPLRAYEKKFQEKLGDIKKVEKKIDDLSQNFPSAIKNFFKLRVLKQEKVKKNEELKPIEKSISKMQGRISRVKEYEAQYATEAGKQELREAEHMVKKFYETEASKWEKSPYSKEDISRHFNEEHLTSLSLEEYVLLMKRFPREMVTHVTRQGVRDHISHHSGGEGQYADGFMKIAADGRLRSALGGAITSEAKEERIADMLHFEKWKDRKEAQQELEEFLIPREARGGEGATYGDRAAIHFAAEEVADSFYGSERGNEIFIAYPSALIASQHHFYGGMGGLTEKGGGAWNDKWVWANEEKGIDINAGIVFIPQETQVDPNTGSRYELDSSKNPILKKKNITAIRSVVASPDFLSIADEIDAKTWEEKGKPDFSEQRKKLEEKIAVFGAFDEKVLDIFFTNRESLHKLVAARKAMDQSGGGTEEFERLEIEIKRGLREQDLLYEKPKHTISSQQFWDTYFQQHPSKRPSKIVFYKGDDPTQALNTWRSSEGITPYAKQAEDVNVGFSSHHVPKYAPESMAGSDRFRSIAEEIIQKRFGNE